MTGPIDYGRMAQGLLGSMVMPVADPIAQGKRGLLGPLGSEGARTRVAGGRTRASTPKYEVYDMQSGTIALGGVSKTDATIIARQMGAGRFYARPVKR
jgi:hypothetical protein